MALIRLKRGTRAQLQSAANGGELHEGEPYYVTDEERVAVGTGTSGYVESVTPGDLAEVATSGSYEDLDDKPSIPSSPGDVGARPAGDVPWGDVADKPAAYPPAPHTHSIGDVTGLQTALDGKAGTGDVFDGDYGSLDNIPSTFPPASHTHPAAQISDASTVGRNVLTATNAANARSAIGAGTSNFSGSYDALDDKPSIPSAASDVGAVAYEGSTPLKLWTGTQAQYDSISSPDANTVYVVRE